MTDKILSILKDRFTVKELESTRLKANGMTFDVKSYKAEGLGHVSVMRAKGFFGLMKMDTLIVNPIEIDLPLYSYDRIFAAGNDTLIVELYDTVLGSFNGETLKNVKTDFSDLEERDPGEHWYDDIKLSSSISKKGKAKNVSNRFEYLTMEHLHAYLYSGEAKTVQDYEAKQNKTRVYVNGLLEKGGPSTDVFKGAIGEERTRKRALRMSTDRTLRS